MNGSGVPDLPVHLPGVVLGPQAPKNHPDVPTRTSLLLTTRTNRNTTRTTRTTGWITKTTLRVVLVVLGVVLVVLVVVLVVLVVVLFMNEGLVHEHVHEQCSGQP